MLKSLLSDIDENLSLSDTEDKKFYWILFETLCLEEGQLFYNVLASSREKDMYDLVPDENGEILIYGIKHAKKLSKYAKK